MAFDRKFWGRAAIAVTMWGANSAGAAYIFHLYEMKHTINEEKLALAYCYSTGVTDGFEFSKSVKEPNFENNAVKKMKERMRLIVQLNKCSLIPQS